LSTQEEQVRLAGTRWPLHQMIITYGQREDLLLMRVELSLLHPPRVIHRFYLPRTRQRDAMYRTYAVMRSIQKIASSRSISVALGCPCRTSGWCLCSKFQTE